MTIVRGLGVQEYAALRGEVEAWFDYTCNIYTTTETDDDYGGHTQVATQPPKAANVPCEIIGGVGQRQEVLADMVEREKEFFTVTVPFGTDVAVDDLIEIIEEDLILEVTAVYGPESIELERVVIAQRGTDITLT